MKCITNKPKIYLIKTGLLLDLML